jgi:hypothetical protein
MRLGLLGPAAGALDMLRESVEFLVGDAAVDQVIYLGNDDAIERVLAAWAEELFGGEPSEDAFLERVAALAPRGEAGELERLLTADAAVQRLGAVRCLPPPPARAVEMLGDRIVLLVHDKAHLDEDDIANANLVVYGRSPAADLKRFGHRYFFTPGPMREGRIGVVDLEDDGRIAVSLYDPGGVPHLREILERRTGKVVVAP